MLVRITNSCKMGCSHCMINAVPNGEIMSWTVFEKTVKFIQETRIPFIMLSGGEPIDHPLFLGIVNYAKKHGLHTIILSNGMFLEDKELREKVLDLGCVIQITNDKRYYPKTVPIIKHELLCYEDTLRQLSPFGRALKNHKNEFTRMSPLCYNLRSAVHTTGDFATAIALLRSMRKMCIPSVNVDGSISAGETNFCHIIGNVDSSNEEITKRILKMKCNNCGLEENLSPMHKKVIGL